jgi:hypothetical protein
MKIEIPADVYEQLAALIKSDDSPVGIDAEKTHVMILHKLIQIERRLDRLERSGLARADRPDTA